MDDIKPWYLSRTIWASIVSLVVAVLGLLGYTVDLASQSALTDAIFQAVIAVAGLVAIWGRLSARNRIR